MGGFTFPPFGTDEPDSNFLDLYNRFADSYMDPSDPEVAKYQQMANAPSRGDEILRDYYNKRPSYLDYQPSTGRKLLSVLLGTLSGGGAAGGYQVARGIRDEPYMREFEEWKSQGPLATFTAKSAADTQRRDLAATKFGIQQKATIGHRKQQESRRMAAEVADEAARTERENRIRDESEFRQNMATQLFDLRNEMFDYRKSHDAEVQTRLQEENKKREEAKAEEARSLEKTNKRLSQYASQHGIDSSGQTALSIARALAGKRALEHPAFKDILQASDETEEGFVVSKKAGDRARLLKIFIDNLAQKYLKGEF